MGKIYGEMWFQSKTAQIYPREFSAFGISCTDRYGGKRQIVDMLNFCETCAFYEVEHFVESVFFDKSSCFMVTCDCMPKHVETIERIARGTIRSGQPIVNDTPL